MADAEIRENLTFEPDHLETCVIPKVKMSAIQLTKNSVEIGENLAFEINHLETCVLPLLRVIWLQGFQF